MKNSKVCPKCGSQDIIVAEGDVRPYGAGNNIMTGLTIFSAVPIDRYICRDCGFLEEWINTDKLKKLEYNKNVRKI